VELGVISGDCRWVWKDRDCKERTCWPLGEGWYKLLRMKEELCIEDLAVSEIGERYGAFRIVSPRADGAMVKSIREVWADLAGGLCENGGGYELIDGFNGSGPAGDWNKTTLRVKTIEVSARVCKAAIIQLNQSGRSINEMERRW